MAEALGMIECRSFAAMVEAADAMVKAAKVELVGYEKTGGGYVTAVIRGDVAAVKAAVHPQVAGLLLREQIVATHIIARPHVNVDLVLRSAAGRKSRRRPGRAAAAAEVGGHAPGESRRDRGRDAEDARIEGVSVPPAPAGEPREPQGGEASSSPTTRSAAESAGSSSTRPAPPRARPR